jgi:hypothetical protein
MSVASEAESGGEGLADLEAETGDDQAEDDLGDAGKSKGAGWVDPEPAP